MISQSVNRTALHPGGVQYVVAAPRLSPSLLSPVLTRHDSRPGKGHTELEEELLETAHIDYERVAIVSRPEKRSGGGVEA
jgi:phosphoenolpyruvate carboxykinase (ATP)